MERSFYILLGTNLGDKRKNFDEAIDLLRGHFEVKKKSAIYQSAAWGYDSDAVYWNCALELRSAFDPNRVLEKLLAIEKQMGRTRSSSGGYEDRVIDLDILAVDEEVIENEQLSVPHPRLHLRQFALQPLVELAPEWRHPLLHLTATELVISCEDSTKSTQIL